MDAAPFRLGRGQQFRPRGDLSVDPRQLGVGERETGRREVGLISGSKPLGRPRNFQYSRGVVSRATLIFLRTEMKRNKGWRK